MARRPMFVNRTRRQKKATPQDTVINRAVDRGGAVLALGRQLGDEDWRRDRAATEQQAGDQRQKPLAVRMQNAQRTYQDLIESRNPWRDPNPLTAEELDAKYAESQARAAAIKKKWLKYGIGTRS